MIQLNVLFWHKNMGKKAKLKQTRREESSTEHKTNPRHFVEDLQRQGYELKQVKRSPEIPQEKIDPQV